MSSDSRDVAQLRDRVARLTERVDAYGRSIGALNRELGELRKDLPPPAWSDRTSHPAVRSGRVVEDN